MRPKREEGMNWTVMPLSAATDETFKKAPESKKKQGHQKEFGLRIGAGGPGNHCELVSGVD